MSFLDHSKLGRTFRRWAAMIHPDIGHVEGILIAVTGNIANAVNAVLPDDGHSTDLSIFAGIACTVSAAAMMGPGIMNSLSSRIATHTMYVPNPNGDDIEIRATGPMRHLAVLIQTREIMQNLFSGQQFEPRLTAAQEKIVLDHMQDLAEALQHIELRTADKGVPFSYVSFSRSYEFDGKTHTQVFARVDKHPDDLRREAAAIEAESLLPPPTPVQLTAAAAPTAELREKTREALQYLEIKSEINTALAPPQPRARVASTPEFEADAPAFDRPSTSAMKMKV